ncbi:MAG: hypothetical protein JWS10_4179 [Cypionkella sp.]|uniref:acyltransferase n=1 Tax=Cypionkella sp. TaxID=2811411 RepID=UPI0026230A72|nr:acyltransferase [Cypionkella sp.]MDB5661564.1 hypothetical protein [Cypionkella sp.]
MTDEKVYKPNKSRMQRLVRLIASSLDPRALVHAFKVLNYYNHTHVMEVRKLTRGQNVRISPTASFANGQNIILGDRVRVGANSSLWAGPGRGKIVLSEDALLAPGVMITAANYRFNDSSPVNDQAMDEADVFVGRDVWLGYGAVVLPGVTIGDYAIVAAGSIVRRDIPKNAIVAGNPAKVVGYRFGAVSEASDSEADQQ